MKPWDQLSSAESINKTIESLKRNNIMAELVDTAVNAKGKVLELIPQGAEIMTMSSQTLELTGLKEAIDGSGNFNSVHSRLAGMDRSTQSREMQRLGAAPEWAVGSCQAVTEDGQIMFASNTGSQLPAYAYGADHVVLVVGVQKIVADMNEGMKRIYDYCLPKEDARFRAAHGSGSGVNKMLVINAEKKTGRTQVIFVNDVLGF